MKARHLTLPLAVCGLFVISSCTEEKIRTYRIAESEEAIATTPTRSPTSPSATGTLTWKAPAAWKEETPGQFQTALYSLGSAARVAISSLPGDAGGELANVNRWRGQVGLAPVEDAGGQTLGVEGEGITAKWFDLRGETECILAAMLSVGGNTWFFKLNAPTTEIEARGKEFMEFLATVQLAPPAEATPEPPPTDKPGIALQVPEGWEKSEGSSMRVASFSISGNAVPDADVSVIPLFGDSGSTMENVNRWRAQLRLPAVASENDPELGAKMAGASGEMLITHMASTESLFDGGKKGAISTAILKAGDHTWFFKLTGEAELVSANREKFEAFVLSAKLP